ncbi:DoxX family protein [Antrihabitans cavernicola]|uniref:DoxX family protein n=1 Tax=Antrihabitans cavernicola TaxID=2495913 RepID=A0A5A7SGA9_9NOCA|nr:DoxX family protein [Spelaeibacter cavernicola]KAA0024479.1 DoxX family protein [Spelaeibacter cavernicola]
MTSTTSRDIALLIARIGLGIVFIAHGWQKVVTNGLDATKTGFTGMGVPAPALSAYYAAFVELVGGAALILGVLTSIVSVLLLLDMVGAFFTVHIDKGIFVSDGGYELVLVLAIASLLLAAFGGGRFAVDALFRRKNSTRTTVTA